MEAEVRLSLKLAQSPILETDIVGIVQVIYPDDTVALIQ
jgi:hypothetical protein